MTQPIIKELVIPLTLAGLRLDQALAKLLPEFSRTELQEWIKTQQIRVNHEPAVARQRLYGGETIQVAAQKKAPPAWEAEPIALDIIFEDDDLLVINKPAGLVTHPAPGNQRSTLLNALLYHAPSLNQLPRAGIIHRLDKDTSGLLVVAKTELALKSLLQQMKKRSIKRIYQALITGTLTSGGTIDAPIGRHPIQRKRMAIIDTGKDAITHYRISTRFRAHTRLKIQLETGRTHQIRVHLAHIQHPIVGDPIYGGRLQLPKGAPEPVILALRQFKRQALHASELSLIHPRTQQTFTWHAPLPEDFQKLIEVLTTWESMKP